MKRGLAKSNNGSSMIQRTEMMNMNGASKRDGRMPKTQVFQSANNNDLIERTEFVEPGQSTNNSNMNQGRMPQTEVFQSADGNDLVERTQFVKPAQPEQATKIYNGNGNGRVPKTEVVRGANKNDLVERTRFVKDDDSETALSMNDITDIVQALSGLTQYLPLLSVVPEVQSLPPPRVNMSWYLVWYLSWYLVFVYSIACVRRLMIFSCCLFSFLSKLGSKWSSYLQNLLGE